MKLLAKSILFFGLTLLLNACVYHPHHLYDGGYGSSHYNRGYGNYHGNHFRGSRKRHGNGYHGRRHH